MTGAWLPPRAAQSAERLLICLPHAGGGALSYLSWRREFAPHVEVLPALLPGRDDRGDEQLVSDIDALVTELAGAAADRVDRPFALYGHSMGALLAFELAHALTDLGKPPVCLVVSGCDAPHRHRPDTGRTRPTRNSPAYCSSWVAPPRRSSAAPNCSALSSGHCGPTSRLSSDTASGIGRRCPCR